MTIERLPPIEAVVIFTRVAETGSFTAAARTMGIPLATVSKRVAELEQHLGVRLIARTTRRSALTESGQRLFGHGRLIIDALKRAADEAASSVIEPSGRLRLTMPSVLIDVGVGKIVTRFSAAHPKLRCELDVSDRYVDLVAEGYDLAVRIGKLGDSTLVRRKIGSTEASLFASPELITRHGMPSSPAELSGFPLIGERVASNDHQVWMLYRGQQEPLALEFTPRFSANSVCAIADAIEGGLGIGRLPTWVGHKLVEDGKAVQVLPGWAGAGLDISLVYPASRGMPAGTRLLLETLMRETSTLFVTDTRMGVL